MSSVATEEHGEPADGVRSEGPQLTVCPHCRKDLKKHSLKELMACRDAVDDDDDQDDQDEAERERAAAERVRQHRQRREAEQRDSEEITGTPAGEEVEPAHLAIIETTSRPALPAVATDGGVFLLAGDDEEWEETADGAGISQALPPRTLPLVNGEVDLEGLAVAMRNVLDRERDDVIRRGGPIEKQNIQLKERLAEQIEETKRWRDRAQAASTARNALQEQLTEAQRQIRKIRADNQKAKSNDEVRILETKGIIGVVEKHSKEGWSYRNLGNGHYGIYLHREWITDLAGSGQGNKVNMATRNKLKKAGLPV